MKKSKLNVGVFTYDFYPIFGGMGRHVYEFYLQNKKQNRVNLFIFSPNENNLSNHIPFHTETKDSKFKNIALSIKFNQEINNLIRLYDLEIVHIHGGPGGIFLTKKLPVPVIYTVHHTYWQQYNYISSQRWKYIFYLFEKKSYFYADKIICVSDDTKKVLYTRYGIAESKLITVPNGIDVSKYKPRAKIHDSKHVLYLGRLDKRKGVDFLVKSMKLINAKDPEIVLDIVGEGNLRSSLEHFAKRNNLNIIFHGRLTDETLNRLYKTISMQVVPSIFEGFGLSVLEGMAKGIAIIGTNVDGVRELIYNDRSGLLAEYGNKYDLSKKIISLINDKEKRLRIVKKASSTLEKFDNKNTYERTIVVYRLLT